MSTVWKVELLYKDSKDKERWHKTAEETDLPEDAITAAIAEVMAKDPLIFIYKVTAETPDIDKTA